LLGDEVLVQSVPSENKVVDDIDTNIFLNQDNIFAAVECGNTRATAHMSIPLGEELPELEEISVVELARKSGDLCTLLFVVVWRQVSKGKMEYAILEKLREYVLSPTTKNLALDGMMQYIPGIY
jgi:hypothetical protein